MNRQLGALARHRADLIHMSEIKLRVDALAVQIHRHRKNVHVAGALTIAKQRALYPISTGHQAQFRSGDRAPSIVVSM